MAEQVREVLNMQQAAEFLQVPVETMRKWRSQGTGPRSARAGKHVRYRRAELLRWLIELEGQEVRRGA